MFDFYAVSYTDEERESFCDYLTERGYDCCSAKEHHCFPFCIDIANKEVVFSNTNMLMDYASKGGRMMSVAEFKNLLNLKNFFNQEA